MNLEEELPDPKETKIPIVDEISGLKSKRGWPRKGTRFPTRTSERIVKKRNQI